jgi:hypothetical protein
MDKDGPEVCLQKIDEYVQRIHHNSKKWTDVMDDQSRPVSIDWETAQSFHSRMIREACSHQGDEDEETDADADRRGDCPDCP